MPARFGNQESLMKFHDSSLYVKIGMRKDVLMVGIVWNWIRITFVLVCVTVADL